MEPKRSLKRYRPYQTAYYAESKIITAIIELQQLRARAEIANVLFQHRLTTKAVQHLMHLSSKTIMKMEKLRLLHRPERRGMYANNNDDSAEEIYVQLLRERFEAVRGEVEGFKCL